MPPRPPTRTSQDALLLGALGARVAGSRGPLAQPQERGVLHWLPVLVPLALFSQVALLGLRPAARESARLGAAEARLVEAYEGELERAAHLERVRRAQADPIYLERERRLLLAADSPLLER